MGMAELEISRAGTALAKALAEEPGTPLRNERIRSARAAIEHAQQRLDVADRERLAQQQHEARRAVADTVRGELDQLAAGLLGHRAALDAATAAKRSADAELRLTTELHNAAVARARTRLLELGVLAQNEDADGATANGLVLAGVPWTPAADIDVQARR